MDSKIAANVILDSLKAGKEIGWEEVAKKVRRPRGSVVRDLKMLTETSNEPIAKSIVNWMGTFSNSSSHKQRKEIAKLALEIRDSIGHWGFKDSVEMAIALGVNHHTLKHWVQKYVSKQETIFFDEIQFFSDSPDGLLTFAMQGHTAPLPRDEVRSMAQELINERLQEIRELD